MLNGKVTPKDAPSDKVGLASGKDIRIAAGTAMQDALAAKVARTVAPPTENPRLHANPIPINEENKGMPIPKPINRKPNFFKLPSWLAVIKPISNKNKAKIPLNKSKNKLQAYVDELVEKLFNEYPKV